MQPNYRSLAFLLSLGALPLACAKEPADTDGGDSTAASTTTNNTTGTDPTQATEPTSTSGTTTTEPEPTTFLTSNSETGDIGSETDTDLPPATDPNCIAFAAHMIECLPRYAEYQETVAQICEQAKMMGMVDGDACVQAVDAFYVCMSMIDCAELMDVEKACLKEGDAAELACPSLEDNDDDTDSGGAESTSG